MTEVLAKPKKPRTPRPVSVAPKPDGTLALTFKASYTAEQRAEMVEDQKTITARLATDRKTLAGLKAALKRKAKSERVTIKACYREDGILILTDAAGNDIPMSKLTPGQLAQASRAAKAAQ